MAQQDIPGVPAQQRQSETQQPTANTQSSQSVDGAPPQQGEVQHSGGSFGGMGLMLLMFIPMIVIIFWMNRSQGKKQREFESKLKKGDRVVTTSGIVGRVADVSPSSRYVKLEITSGVKIEILKTAIQGLDAGESVAPSSPSTTSTSSSVLPKESSDKNKK